MRNSTQNLIVGAVLLGLALFLYFYLIPIWVPPNDFGAMSPQFFPRFGTILIGIGGITLATLSVIAKQSEIKTSNNNQTNKSRPLKVLITTAIMIFFIIIFRHIGYLYAAPTTIAALMVVFGSRRPFAVILVSTATTAVLFVIFNYALNLPLP